MVQVEEQIAVQAHTFLGTSTSTVTHTIAFERMGKGMHANNHYFESMDSC